MYIYRYTVNIYTRDDMGSVWSSRIKGRGVRRNADVTGSKR